MEENTQEKNLIQKKEKGFFNKIKSFFRNLFSKKVQEVENTVESTLTEKENKDFKEYIKKTEDEETRLLELQRRYRRGEIAESDLTDEQIEALSKLYDRQIAELKRTIAEREQKIAEYKKSKIKENNA